MNTEKLKIQARYSENYDYIIDSDGNRVELSDPRVVFICVVDCNQYIRRITQTVFKRYNKKCRISEKTSSEVLQYARKICTGRECIPCNATAGVILKDLEDNREENEISIYMTLNQEGPCQNGAWPLLWDTFARRLDLKNVIFCAHPKLQNHFFGLGYNLLPSLVIGALIGELLLEAKHTLMFVARDKEQAMEIFEKETDQLIEKLGKKKLTIKPRTNWNLKSDIYFLYQSIIEFSITIPFIKEWTKNISTIPHKKSITKIPRVLILGGLNVFFVHYPVTDYFLKQGIIPQLVAFSEGMSFIESEPAFRYSFQRGRMSPKKQFSLMYIVRSYLLARKSKKENALRALESKFYILYIDICKKMYRKRMERTGLFFDREIPFMDMVEMGHQYSSLNGFNESISITGRYLASVKSKIFDGMVNLASFNCQPAMTSLAIISPLAAQNDIPYVTIDCEGPFISANHLRLLETITVQAKRLRADRCTMKF